MDFLGNPVGLVKDLGGGVKDLFYEPYQGAIQGPEEFVEGKCCNFNSAFIAVFAI